MMAVDITAVFLLLGLRGDCKKIPKRQGNNMLKFTLPLLEKCAKFLVRAISYIQERKTNMGKRYKQQLKVFIAVLVSLTFIVSISTGSAYAAESAGEVIGINTMKYADFGVENLGFAIPIDTVVRESTLFPQNIIWNP
jgi:hypothetical protein